MTNQGADSLIAPYVARRLAERLAIEAQLQVDYFDGLEADLDDGALQRDEAVEEIAVLIDGPHLDPPQTVFTPL